MLATSKVVRVDLQHELFWRSPDAGEAILDDFRDFSSKWIPQVLATSKVTRVDLQHEPFWRSPDTVDVIFDTIEC